jgi:hypothetical protein
MNPANPAPTPILLRVLWVLLRAWGACVLAYLLGIVLIASVAEGLTTASASVLAMVLVAAEVVVTLVALVWTYLSLQALVPPAACWLGVLVFSGVQLATCGIAVITTLLALNR